MVVSRICMISFASILPVLKGHVLNYLNEVGMEKKE